MYGDKRKPPPGRATADESICQVTRVEQLQRQVKHECPTDCSRRQGAGRRVPDLPVHQDTTNNIAERCFHTDETRLISE